MANATPDDGRDDEQPEQNHTGDRATPATDAPNRRRQGGNSSRKRRPQEPPSSELRYPRRRALKACRLCRARKTKCDNVHPTCGFCVSIGATCSYDESHSDYSSFDPASLEILRTLGQLVDYQRDILEVIRADRHTILGSRADHASHPGTGRGNAVTPPVSIQHEGWNRTAFEHSCAWVSPEYQPSAIEANNSGTGLVFGETSNAAYSPRTPLAQTRDVQVNYADASPGAFPIAGNPGALRWFGLLANDTRRETVQTAEPEAEVGRSFLDQGNFADDTPLQRATRIVDDSTGTAYDDHLRASRSDDIAESNQVLEKQLWQAKNSIQLLQGEKLIFDNFVHNISLWIDLFDPRCHFSAVVPRLALQNAGLMNAILALSCHHLSIGHESSGSETAHRNDALQYHYQTLHYVQKAMRYSSYQNSKELLATVLITSTYEMLAGSQKDWERHLQGVFWILRSQYINVEIEALESAVWWAWLRQDVWAAFREKRKTYTAWIPKKTYDVMTPCEMASRAIWHFAQVVNFCSPESGVSDGDRLQNSMDRVNQLRRMLDEWRQNLPVEFHPLPTGSGNTTNTFEPLLIYPPCYGLAMQAHYVSRILLSFHEPSSFSGIDTYLERMRAVKSWIHIVCGIGMTLSDAASSILSSQCIFIAGMFSQDRREQEGILELLSACRRRTGWPVSPLEVELSALWSDSTSMSSNQPLLG